MAENDNVNSSRPVRRLDYGYFSPQWLHVLDDLKEIFRWTLFACLLFDWWFFLVWRNVLGLPPGKVLIVCLIGFAVAGIGARVIDGFLIRYRGGYGFQPHGSNRLVGEFSRGLIWLHIKGERRSFLANLPHQFLMREHPERIEEARAEERARAYGNGQQADYFRRSFEIILDTPNERIRLAEVAFEDQARDMIRHLHELDAYARGSEGAGTQLRAVGQAGASPLGMRPPLQ